MHFPYSKFVLKLQFNIYFLNLFCYSEKDFDGKDKDEIAKKHKMRTVFITGKDGLTAHDAALILISEARELLNVCKKIF